MSEETTRLAALPSGWNYLGTITRRGNDKQGNFKETGYGEALTGFQGVDLIGGADGSRTHDLLNAIQALSQLSYGPTDGKTEC